MPFATEHSKKQDFEPMHGIRRETVYPNSAGWGTSRNKRKIETDTSFVSPNRTKRNLRKALNVRNNRINILVKLKENVILQDKEKKECYDVSFKPI